MCVPARSRGVLVSGEVTGAGGTVTIDGVTITAGDLIVGDEDGS